MKLWGESLNNKNKDISKKPIQKQNEKNLIELLAEHEKPLSNLINLIADKFLKHQERETRFSFRMSGLLAVLVVFIVSIAAILTYYNKVDGSTFTFLLGLVVGYVLTFFTGLIYPSE